MGGVLPADSAATGNVTIVAGSKTETGSIIILTRSLEQSAEHIVTPDRDQTLIYSRGSARETEHDSSNQLSLELAQSSHSPAFPVAIIAAALNSDWSLQYLGLEDLNGAKADHIRFWNTYSSNSKFSPLAEFSARDVWFDALSHLPRKIAYEQREATGPEEPRVRKEVYFSDFRNVNGVLFPFEIRESFNGTPWTTIKIEKVALNTGLTDTDFPVE